MKVKRYLVREMQEAIRLIKQDLGPDAVIVGSYKVPAKGLAGLFSPRLLEVTAALDENPEVNLSVDCLPAQMVVGAGAGAESRIGPGGGLALPSVMQADHPRTRSFYLTAAGSKGGGSGPDLSSPKGKGEFAAGRPAGTSTDQGMAGRRGEEARGLFEVMLGKQFQAGLNDDYVLRWRKTLLEMDVQEDIVERLLSALDQNQDPDPAGDGSQQIYLNLFKQVLDLLEPARRSVERARVLAFVGPAGVGKTTTLAKLATRFSLYDQKKIALVTVHTYRIGVAEQLQAYGDFLGVPLEVVMTPAELARTLESHSDKDYVLIDTAGRSARNAGQVLELKSFLDVLEEPRDIFLVLSAATKNRDLFQTAREFRKINYSELIFTKLDETETHGSILNLVCALGVPVAYLADGQGVPDDISAAGPKKIAKLLFRGVDPDELMAD